MRPSLRRLVPRLLPCAVGLVATLLVASSCSLDAAVTTDRSGRITSVDAIRIRSTVQDVVLAMLVRGTELALELRWEKALAERAGFEPAGGY